MNWAIVIPAGIGIAVLLSIALVAIDVSGQRKDRPKDLSWDNLERVKVTIICEAMALVFSGEYKEKESGQ